MPDEPIKETVDKPEEVNPAPEHVPPPVNPDPAVQPEKHHMEDRVTALESGIAELKTLLESGGKPDSSPVRKPWTHYGSK